MSEKLTITIDGIECSCEKGEYLYDVARRNGIYIPVLCRHDGFEDHRACCRICIVEVEQRGRTKVVTSCVYPIEAECTVRTASERILEERSVIYALLGRRAPEARVIDEMSAGLDMSGFERLIKVDGEKCILCGLCVQACSSLGTGAISTVLRGTEKMVDTPYGNPSAACVGCLSCASVCPTGAIEYEDGEDGRSIWHRRFDVVKCPKCGRPMGTPESIEHAGGTAEMCDECRKKAIADEMMHTYRHV